MSTYKSASLTLYNKKNGFLLANEYRYREKKNLYHPIGGKVENFDKDLFFTSIREFIEETNLLKHTIINKGNLSIDNFCLDIYNLLNKYKEFFDICVNKNLKYFHRYYIINLDNIEDLNLKKNLINLPKFFNNKFKTELNYLIWYNKNFKIYNKSSWLLKILINKKIYKDFYTIKK